MNASLLAQLIAIIRLARAKVWVVAVYQMQFCSQFMAIIIETMHQIAHPVSVQSAKMFTWQRPQVDGGGKFLASK